jgi:hypothetical protein
LELCPSDKPKCELRNKYCTTVYFEPCCGQ